MAQIRKRILEEARKQENWSFDKKYNYGPIDYLKAKVLYKGGQYSRDNHDLYEKMVHRVTDQETYFVYLFIDYDLYVDAEQIFYEMKRAFPDTTYEQMKEWLYKHMSEEQWTDTISLAPVKVLVSAESINS